MVVIVTHIQNLVLLGVNFTPFSFLQAASQRDSLHVTIETE